MVGNGTNRGIFILSIMKSIRWSVVYFESNYIDMIFRVGNMHLIFHQNNTKRHVHEGVLFDVANGYDRESLQQSDVGFRYVSYFGDKI